MFLTRNDDQFVDAAFSFDRRTTMLAKLHRHRKLWIIVSAIQAICLVGESIGRFFGERASPSALPAIGLCFAVSLIILRDVATRIWLVEIIQRTTNKPGEPNQSA